MIEWRISESTESALEKLKKFVSDDRLCSARSLLVRIRSTMSFAGDRTPDDEQREASLQPMEKTMNTRKIPRTDSIEELARFWDTHDLTEFKDELEEVSEPVFERRPGTVISLHLRPREAALVKRVAKARGVKEATLLREWVLE